MEGYKSLTEAVSKALEVCNSWYGNETEDVYGVEEMSYIAQITDIESPNRSDDLYYVVFPDGEIGLLCTYDKSIYRLFIPTESDFVPSGDLVKDLEDDEPNYSMPVVAETNTVVKKDYCFCTYCGAKLQITSKFCTECGKKIEVR